MIAKINRFMTQYRQKVWWNEDVDDIKKKLPQCDIKPLSDSQKKEIEAYWHGMTGMKVPTLWHEYFYSRNGQFSLQYVPTCLYHYKILYHLNFRPFTMAYIDKCLFD